MTGYESSYDVAVIGLGVMGSALAWQLAQRGLRVVGLERHGRAHDLGSSQGASRLLRHAHFEHPDYLPLALRADALWQQLERETGRALLQRTGALVVGPRGGALVSGTVRGAAAHGLQLRLLEDEALRRFAPLLQLDGSEVGLIEEAAGVLFPTACVLACQELATRHGADLRFHVRAVVPDEAPGRPGPVEIRTGDGTIVAERVIVAAGAWAPQVLASRFLPALTVERVVSCWFEPVSERHAFGPERFPVVLWDHALGPLCVFPSLDADGVKVAHHQGALVADADELDRSVSDAEADRLRQHLAAAAPSAAGPLRRASACMYTTTRDGLFAIGPVGTGAVVLVSACCGHGFKFAPVVGEMVADLVTSGSTGHPIDTFRPDRAGLANALAAARPHEEKTA